jgi:hypothetical protein
MITTNETVYTTCNNNYSITILTKISGGNGGDRYAQKEFNISKLYIQESRDVTVHTVPVILVTPPNAAAAPTMA